MRTEEWLRGDGACDRPRSACARPGVPRQRSGILCASRSRYGDTVTLTPDRSHQQADVHRYPPSDPGLPMTIRWSFYDTLGVPRDATVVHLPNVLGAFGEPE